MKRIIYILFLMPLLGVSQKHFVQAVKFDTITSTERDAFTVPDDEVWWIYNETTGQFEVNVKNGGWNAFTGGGATQLSELSDVSGSTATNRFALLGNGTTFAARAITEADISDLGTYIPTSDIIDEDNMSSDSNTKVPTQQSVKAYVDANSGAGTADITISTITNGSTYTLDYSSIYVEGDALRKYLLQKTETGAAATFVLDTFSNEPFPKGTMFFVRNNDDDPLTFDPVAGVSIIGPDGANLGDGVAYDAPANSTGILTVTYSDVWTYQYTGPSTGGSSGLSSTDIDTFVELDAIVADKSLLNTNDAQTLTNKTIDAANNTLQNITGAMITDGSIGSYDLAPNSVTSSKISSAGSAERLQILRVNSSQTGTEWATFMEVTDIGAADKTLSSSDVHKFNYTDDSVTFTLDNSLLVSDEITFAVTDIDSIITVVPDTGVSIIGNGTEPIDGGFQIDSLNIGKVKKLASNLYYAMGYIKPYSPSVSLIVPSLDNANTVAYIDAREFSASSNGASVSPTDQTSNGTTFTSTDITKQVDADSDPTFSFNGTSSRISLGNNFNFTAGVAQSIGIFISADGFGTGTRFAKRDDATGGSNDHFAIYNGYYYMGNNEGNPSFSSTTNVLITLTKTTGDVWYIYENGTQRATGAWTNETSAVDLLIGAQVNGGGFSDYSTGEIEVFFITDDFITNTEAGTIATEINTR